MTKLMDITFGDWLLARMRERSLSQSEFSRRAGLTRQAISYYTTGKSKQPDEFALQKIAAALQVPPEEVYRAAGIPLSKTSENPIIKQITYLTSDLPEAEQKDILEFVKLRRRLAEERGTYETKRTAKKSPATK